MQTLRRNDPCPCGSGKKYKHCCLKKEETQAVSDWSQAVPRAIKWLMAEHPHAVREALDNGFFGSLDENEGKILHAHKSWETTLINALDWLLASVHKSLRLCDLCKELGFDCSDAHTVCEGWFGKLRPTLVWCSCAR